MTKDQIVQASTLTTTAGHRILDVDAILDQQAEDAPELRKLVNDAVRAIIKLKNAVHALHVPI